jgi:GNAT superfamily N-acetyltransferase
MNSEFRIRRALSADAPRLADLANQLSYSSAPEQVAARLRALDQSHDQAVFVAAGADGRAVGFVHVQIRHAVEHDTRAEVASLVVDESVRSRGVGRRLMEAAEAWAQNKGMTTIVLRSNAMRERAHVFYERLGYRHTKSQKFFMKELPPASTL